MTARERICETLLEARCGLVLLTRPECELCEQMRAALSALQRRAALPPLACIDVDDDATLQRRYGLKIPVLLLDGSPICSVRLDEPELLAALARRAEHAPAARS